MISMEFALSKHNMIPHTAWFEFVIFKLDNPAAFTSSNGLFRSTLDKYNRKIFNEYYTERVKSSQGLWMPFDGTKTVTGWSDFGFAYYSGSEMLVENSKNGITNYLSVGEPFAHVDIAATNTSDEFISKLKKCKTSDCKMASSSYITDVNDEIIYYAKESEIYNEDEEEITDNLTTIPLNLNPRTKAGNTKLKLVKNLYNDAAVSGTNVSGVFVGGIDDYSAILDYKMSNFKHLTTTPLYDSELNPCTLSGAWTLDFLKALTNKVRSEHGSDAMIMGSSVYTQFPHSSRYVDIAATETNWLRNNDVYTPVDHDTLFYYRSNAYHKPYLFLQNTNFTAWTYEMTENYMQTSLLYGIWPGFAYSEDGNTTYFADESMYGRDRDLFNKYIPALKTVTEQGWEPVTCASVSNGYVERWGGSEKFPVYFTVMIKPDSVVSSPQTLAVSVDLKCLGVTEWEKDEVNVTEIVQTNSSSVSDVSEGDGGSMTFKFEFEAGKTYIFVINGNFTVSYDDDEFVYEEYGSEEFDSASSAILISRVMVFVLALLVAFLA